MNIIEKLLRESGHIGAENAINSKQLAWLAGYQNVRALQSAIQGERDNNALILSSISGGYFLPADGEAGKREIEAYIKTLRNRALNTLRILKTARKALQQQESQISMW